MPSFVGVGRGELAEEEEAGTLCTPTAGRGRLNISRDGFKRVWRHRCGVASVVLDEPLMRREETDVINDIGFSSRLESQENRREREGGGERERVMNGQRQRSCTRC